MFVLLTDGEGCTLVACPDQDAAESVGAHAVFSDGGVSAWLVPTDAVTDFERVKEILNNGGGLSEIDEAELPETRVAGLS